MALIATAIGAAALPALGTLPAVAAQSNGPCGPNPCPPPGTNTGEGPCGPRPCDEVATGTGACGDQPCAPPGAASREQGACGANPCAPAASGSPSSATTVPLAASSSTTRPATGGAAVPNPPTPAGGTAGANATTPTNGAGPETPVVASDANTPAPQVGSGTQAPQVGASSGGTPPSLPTLLGGTTTRDRAPGAAGDETAARNLARPTDASSLPWLLLTGALAALAGVGWWVRRGHRLP